MDDDDETPSDPDRAAILARRQRFIALALAGLAGATTLDGCAPKPCLDVSTPQDADPQPCLSVSPDPTEPEPKPQPCLSPPEPKPDAQPQPCLSPPKR